MAEMRADIGGREVLVSALEMKSNSANKGLATLIQMWWGDLVYYNLKTNG